MSIQSKNPHLPLRFWSETIGLSPLPLRLKQAMVAIKGEEDVPPSRWGLSSLSQLHLRVSHRLWRGKYFIDRKAVIANLVNHTPTPIHEGWSVERTQVRDFRGRRLTYNSHNGTDFAIPVGSIVCTAAPGKVLAVLSEFNRGGLKIFIDHGNGLITCYAHLARALVDVGQVIKRAQPIAISGYSGLDAAVTFPFGVPHVHFNVWLNGEPVDPFPYDRYSSMWRGGNLPHPATGNHEEFSHTSTYNIHRLNAVIANCKTASVRSWLMSLESIEERAAHTIIQMNYYPTRFSERINVYEFTHSRQPILDLPFSNQQFDGVVFLDDVLPSVIKREQRELKHDR